MRLGGEVEDMVAGVVSRVGVGLAVAVSLAVVCPLQSSGAAWAGSAPSSGGRVVAVQMGPAGAFEKTLGVWSDVEVTAASSKGGTGARIRIDRLSAAHLFAFTYRLPAGYRFAAASDGSVVVEDRSRPVGEVGRPWAVDAAGHTVPTHFSIRHNTLLQQVDFTAANRFPVVADPWWNPLSWNWSRIARVTRASLTKCRLAAGKGTRDTTVTLSRTVDGERLISLHGSPFTVVKVAVANCLAAALG